MKIFILSIGLLLASCSVKAQYNSFLDTLARWEAGSASNIIFSDPPPQWGNSLRGFYYLKGDTIINNTNYKKVYFVQTYTSSSAYLSNGPGGTTFISSNEVIDHGAVAGIREVNKKVYYYNFGTGKTPDCQLLPADRDTIVYDFDLEVGDTVTWKHYPNRVEAIDSILLLDGSYRKRYCFDTAKTNDLTWIEGAGGAFGLLTAYNGPWHEGGCYSYGYSSEGECLYNWEGQNTCDTTVLHNNIQGLVYKDNNSNCQYDNLELGSQGWVIRATNNQGTYYTVSDSTGWYALNAPVGVYQVDVLHPYWQTCLLSDTVDVSNPYWSDTTYFPVYSDYLCPFLTVDISTSFLRRCFSNSYNVTYANNGSLAAQGVYIEIEIDTFLHIDSTSVPIVSQQDRVFRFDIGNLAAGANGQFYIYTTVDCDSTILGQTHCVEAHIYPDTLCLPTNPAWDGSDIQVEGTCIGDSIEFIIENTGTGNMIAPRSYFVTEDHVIIYNTTYQLNAGGDLVFYQPTFNGSTYRIEAAQDVNHPYRIFAATTLEGCTDSTWFSTGFATQYAEDDAAPYLSIDCQQNIGSWDPNDKRGFPRGYGADHYIYSNQDIEYIIRFQNTGTDTAFTVRIEDLFSEYLEPSSIQMGAASHPYTWTLTGEGKLVVQFDNIMLADSNTNEPASHGFVKFRIAQKENNAIGTLIENNASIYFDFNEAVVTNTTQHLIGSSFIITSIQTYEVNEQWVSVKVQPNPFENHAVLKVEGQEFEQLELKIYNLTGQLLQSVKTQQSSMIELNRNGLNTGIYFYQLYGDQQVISNGKFILK